MLSQKKTILYLKSLKEDLEILQTNVQSIEDHYAELAEEIEDLKENMELVSKSATLAIERING